ncbi:MAG: hypothetical protein RR213_00005 [Raoultibacter sp.]
MVKLPIKQNAARGHWGDANMVASEAGAIHAVLVDQRDRHIERGFYWENQIAFAFNSEKMEGNPLTKEQTRSIFETNDLVPFIVLDETKERYYQGLQVFNEQPNIFIDYCEELVDQYLEAYSSLIPAKLLLPNFEKYLEHKPDHAKQAEQFLTTHETSTKGCIDQLPPLAEGY